MDGNQRKRNTYDVGIYKRIIHRLCTMDISYIIDLYNTNNIGIIYDSCNDRLRNIKHES